VISAKSYFTCVAWTLVLTFLCSFAFVGAYVFVVGAIAGGFTDPPLPDWAKGPILEWMMDIPQSASTDYYPSGGILYPGLAIGPQRIDPNAIIENGTSNTTANGNGIDVLAGQKSGQKILSSNTDPNLGRGSKYPNLSTTPEIINYKELWVGYADGNAAAPDGLPFKGQVKLWSSWYSRPPLGCTFHDRNYSSHTGQDFPVETGTPIYATMGGKVIWANRRGPWGNLIIIENGNYQTWFAHQETFNVQTGDIVPTGDLIGWSDSTGNSTGPHLHYGVMWSPDGGITSYWIDPRNFFSPSAITPWGCPK
jgi:murein DD-endopeptidase MepM/ murein hydrolase activator NlpD